MENNSMATSGANAASSGADDQGQNSTSGEQSSNLAYEKLLREKKNTAVALQTTKQELDSLKSWKAQLEEEEQLKNKEYEAVIQNYKSKLEQAENKAKELGQVMEGSKKNTAVLSELKKLGFIDNEPNREAVFKLIDKSTVTVDPTTGVVLGADDAAKDFTTKFGQLGFFGKQQAGVSHNAHSLNLNMSKSLGSMTRDDINKLSIEDKMKMLSDLIPKR